MKLKLVERSTQRTHTKDPKVSVSKKGTFYMNTTAMQLMGITEPVKVKLFQDEDDAQAWYLHLCTDGYAILNPNRKKDGSAQLNMIDIATQVIDSYYHIGKNALRFNLQEPITVDGLKYYPLKLIKESLEMYIPNPNGR